MSTKRAPGPPPTIDGYSYLDLLGSGGYADVFLYEQQLPLRKVAIKVLLTDALGETAIQRFTVEANTMASLSNHPFIVSIFHAGVAPTGQPYLVMEYYPKPNFAIRARSEQFSVAEVLRTGVQVAGAVETAHRAGILHRDIKPANILTSAYGRPGLTDFGISSSLAEANGAEAEGMSIPWAPPEVIGGTGTVDVRADVYSLAATIYTMLARRSPFEVPGGSNRHIDLLARIEGEEVPPIGRADVPAHLERLLRQAMAKVPSMRPSSVAELARSFQAIELDQGLDMTQFEVSEDSAAGPSAHPVDVEAGSTRLRTPTTIVSQEPPAPPRPPGVTGQFAAPATSGGDMISVPVPVASTWYESGSGAPDHTSGRRDPTPAIAAVPLPANHRPAVPTPVAPSPPAMSRPTGSAAPGSAYAPISPSLIDHDTDRRRVVSPQQAPVAMPVAMPVPAHRRPAVVISVVAGCVAVLAAVVLLVVVVPGGEEPPGGEVGSTTVEPPEPVSEVRIVKQGEGSFEVTWQHEGAQPGDLYTVIPIYGDEVGVAPPRSSEMLVVVPAGEPGQRVCVTVQVERAGERSPEVQKCPS